MQSWSKDILIDRLEQIRESISLIQAWCSDYENEDAFLCSPTGMAMLDASILRLQIIGEAVRAIDIMTEKRLFCNYPTIPWHNIIGLRNIISHDYSNINYTMIVNIINKELKTLDGVVAQIIIDQQNEGVSML